MALKTSTSLLFGTKFLRCYNVEASETTYLCQMHLPGPDIEGAAHQTKRPP